MPVEVAVDEVDEVAEMEGESSAPHFVKPRMTFVSCHLWELGVSPGGV